MIPFLREVPRFIADRLAVELEGVNGWEVLKQLPFNRRVRKRLHSSHTWVLKIGPDVADPLLLQLCQQNGFELVELGATKEGMCDPEIWKALSWAAFTGRVAGIIADAPMRTWMRINTSEKDAVRYRSAQHPWGIPSAPAKVQDRIETDSLAALLPLWLWTLSSVSRGEGIPLCQVQAMPDNDAAQAWEDRCCLRLLNGATAVGLLFQALGTRVVRVGLLRYAAI